MLASVLIILCLLHHHIIAFNIASDEGDTRELSIQFKQAIKDAIKKIDNLAIMCPPRSFFYNGSCYFYLPPKQIDNGKGVRFNDVSIDE
ncbi:unnamed protein product, partial [Rotaria sordida]